MAKDFVQSIRIKGEFDSSNIERSMSRIKNAASTVGATQSYKLNEYFEKLTQSFNKLNSMNLSGIGNVKQLREYEKLIQTINRDLENFGRNAAGALSTVRNPWKEDLNLAKKNLNDLLKVNAQGVSQNSISTSYINNLKQASREFNNGTISEIKHQELLNAAIKDTISLLEQKATAQKDPLKAQVLQAEISRVKQLAMPGLDFNSIVSSSEKYTRYLDRYDSVSESMRELNDETKIFTDLQNRSRIATNSAVASLNEQFKAQKQISDQFAHFQNYVGYMFSFASILTTIKNVIRSTFDDVKNLDRAFGSIAMVTEYSVQDMWNSYGQYAEMANRLGQSTKDVIESSALFYQQGLKTADALSLTESTMKLATLAGSDFKTATSQMTAAIRGFNLEMSDSNHITDVYSELAANAAADVNGIAYALSKAAAIADSAGMSFENTAAFLAKMIESTQEAP